MFVEKLFPKRESEKVPTMCGFASIPVMGIYIQGNVGAWTGMERAVNTFIVYIPRFTLQKGSR